MSNTRSDGHSTEIGLLSLALIWGVNFSVIKAALDELDPLVFNALRFPLASLLLYAVLRSRGPLRLPRRQDLVRILIIGLVGNVLYQGFFILGIDRTRAGNASLLLATVPVWTTILSTLVRHERPEPRVWIGVAGTFAGMILVVLGGPGALEVGASTLVGDLLSVGAALVWSVYTVSSRSLVLRYGSLSMTAWTLWIGTVGLVALGVPGLTRLDFGDVSGSAWGGVAYAGVLAIGLAYLLWYRGVQKIGNTRTAVYSNLVPVVALIVAWLWLGEVPGLLQIVGAAVIIGGLTLTRTGPTPRLAPAADGA